MDYLLNESAEPCPREPDPVLTEDFDDVEPPGAAAKSELPALLGLGLGLELDALGDGDSVCEETVQLLVAESPTASFTTANIVGELSAVETTETGCVPSSCQRKAMLAKLWNQGRSWG